jgi:predicted LPLAT superfamily acyltransferase
MVHCGKANGGESSMKVFFYKNLMALSRRTGIWIFVFFSWFIATGYFLFFPIRVAVSVRFYRALFPDKGWYYHLWCTWRQYHHFTYVFLDRFLLRDEQEITHISEGFDLLVEAVKKGKGAIVLMSHMGNWEVAASRMKLKGMKVMLYVGKKYKEDIERMQKDTLKREGVRIIAADQEGGSPFDIVEGIQFLSPHLFALLSGAPILVFFVFRLGSKKYQTLMLPPRYVTASSRADRQEAIRESAQWYANLLEDMVRRHPCEWYHFEPFLK